MLPSAIIGRHLTDLDTPALCIDLEKFEANVQAMAAAHQQAGKNWRPHAKCHKSPAIAHQLIRRGRSGSRWPRSRKLRSTSRRASRMC